MHAEELTRLETRAIEAAGQQSSADILECVMGALWDAGVRDLASVDATAFAAVRDKVQSAPEYQRALSGVLTGYGAAIKQFIDAGEAPF